MSSSIWWKQNIFEISGQRKFALMLTFNHAANYTIDLKGIQKNGSNAAYKMPQFLFSLILFDCLFYSVLSSVFGRMSEWALTYTCQDHNDFKLSMWTSILESA